MPLMSDQQLRVFRRVRSVAQAAEPPVAKEREGCEGGKDHDQLGTSADMTRERAVDDDPQAHGEDDGAVKQ
jgi:hypothetical protein